MKEDPKVPLFFSLIPQEDSFVSRFLKHMDWILLIDVLVLILLGFLMIYSASLRFTRQEVFLGKQFLAFFIGCIFLIFFTVLNYQIFYQHPRFLFLISVFLLLLVLLIGKTYRGAKSWFMLGPFSFQPAEISKLLVILIMASWCGKRERDMTQLKNILVPFLLVFSHIFLILLQPDFGSTLVYFPILIGMMFVSGVPSFFLFALLFYLGVTASSVFLHTYLSLSPVLTMKNLFYSFLYRGLSLSKEFFLIQTGIALFLCVSWWFLKGLKFRNSGFYFINLFLLFFSGSLSSSVVTGLLKTYQKKRLMVFFNPEIDPTGSGYHVIQSVITLGSGKVLGKGLFSGTQSRLGFLPEQHTDFIFSVLGEELGFIVSGLALSLYAVLVWRSFLIAESSRDTFGALVASGIGTMFAFYAILNLAMVMGFAPVTGLPLPFLSYGGSSLISSLAAVGILLSIQIRRFTYA